MEKLTITMGPTLHVVGTHRIRMTMPRLAGLQCTQGANHLISAISRVSTFSIFHCCPANTGTGGWGRGAWFQCSTDQRPSITRRVGVLNHARRISSQLQLSIIIDNDFMHNVCWEKKCFIPAECIRASRQPVTRGGGGMRWWRWWYVIRTKFMAAVKLDTYCCYTLYPHPLSHPCLAFSCTQDINMVPGWASKM